MGSVSQSKKIPGYSFRHFTGYTYDDEEVWKDIPGFSKYEASSWGRIRNKKTKKLIHQCSDNSNYLCCCLFDDNNHQRIWNIHVWILLAFTGVRPQIGRTSVDHKDTNKYNNRIDNLELVSWTENIQRAQKNHLCEIKRYEVTRLSDGQVFRSAAEAQKSADVPYTTFNSFCSSNKNSTFTYKGETYFVKPIFRKDKEHND